MSTCTPIRPFRCWQYVKGEAVPEWCGFTADDMRGWEHCAGEWFVESHDVIGRWYTPAEFQERFRVEEGK